MGIDQGKEALTYEHKLSIEDRGLLRVVVKNVHLKHYPKDFITDREADKLISSLLPETLDKLKKVGRDYNIDRM